MTLPTQELIDKMDKAFLQFNGNHDDNDDDNASAISNYSVHVEDEDNVIGMNSVQNGYDVKHDTKSNNDKRNQIGGEEEVSESDLDIGLSIQQDEHQNQEEGNLFFNKDDENNQETNNDYIIIYSYIRL